MGRWPALSDGGQYSMNGLVAGTLLTSVTAGNPAHTKGAWIQIVAATTQPATWIYVFVKTQTGVSHLIDIGIGGAGSEQIIIPNILSGERLGNVAAIFAFPLTLPVGTRIAARAQSATASSIVRVGVMLLQSGFFPSATYNRVTDYGSTTATSQGTTIDPGATANTKGAYSQIVASSSLCRLLGICVGLAGVNHLTNAAYYLDIAVGAAGSEIIIIPDIYICCASTTTIFPAHFIFPVSIPAGSVISARCQSTDNAAGSRIIDLCLYGVD